jgi:RimJ/RimL family protein N-acetyltransferase
MTNSPKFTFHPVNTQQRKMVHEWLAQDYIREWIHGQGLDNTLRGLEEQFQGKATATYWIAYDKEIPLAFLITLVEEDTVALDLFICNRNYLGKGLSVPLIHQFLLTHFNHISKVTIDPEKTNTKAVHVYQKAGFHIVEEFIAPWHPVPHFKMELDMKLIKVR